MSKRRKYTVNVYRNVNMWGKLRVMATSKKAAEALAIRQMEECEPEPEWDNENINVIYDGVNDVELGWPDGD